MRVGEVDVALIVESMACGSGCGPGQLAATGRGVDGTVPRLDAGLPPRHASCTATCHAAVMSAGTTARCAHCGGGTLPDAPS